MIVDLKYAVNEIAKSVLRGRASFVICPDPFTRGRFVLVAGDHKAMLSDHGAMVTPSISRQELLEHRDRCNELLEKFK